MYQPTLLEASSQRWTHHQPTWKHPDQGGFNQQLYTVEPIADDTTARTFIARHHYSKSCPSMKYRYGMFDKEELVGVAILSIPASEGVLTKVFGNQLIPYVEAVELGRFSIVDRIPCNGETWFLKRVFQLAYKEGVRGIVSFSDPIARTNSQGITIVERE